ncbi:MAG: MFS transporter [Sulfolobales archaeon]
MIELSLYISSIFILYLSSFLINFILPLYLEAIGYAPLLIGFLVGILGIVRVPLSPTAGLIADIIGRRITLVLGSVFSSLGIMLLLLKDFSVLILGRVLVGFFGVFLVPIAWALVSEKASVLGASGRIMAIANALSAIAGALAPVVGGYLASTYGYETVIILSAIFFLSVITLVGAAPSERRKGHVDTKIRREIISTLRRIFRYSILLALEWYLLYSYWMLFPLYMNNLGYSAEVIGLLMTLESLVYIASQPLIGYLIDKYRPRYVLLLTTSSIYGASLAYIPYCRDLLHIALVLVMIALSSSTIAPVVFARVSEVSGDLRAFAMGLLFSGGYLGMTLGTIISGYLAQESFYSAYGHLVIPGLIISVIAISEYVSKAPPKTG